MYEKCHEGLKVSVPPWPTHYIASTPTKGAIVPSPRHSFAALAAAAVLATVVAVPATASATKVTHMRDFVGTWESPGDDLTKLKIAKDGARVTVKIWGNCADEQCYVGEFDAQRLATNVQDGSRGVVALRGQRVPSFATVDYLITLRNGDLVLQQVYDYNEGSTRKDSYEEFTLQKK